MPGKQLTINLQHVVHETIDGETILIHLGTGTYYSLDGVGTEVWELLGYQAEREEIVSRIRERYDADSALVAETVLALLDRLLEEELVLEGPPAAAATPAPALEDPDSTGSFVAPVLHKYTDMQEFMLVDPLHDVEQATGWPHVKAG